MDVIQPGAREITRSTWRAWSLMCLEYLIISILAVMPRILNLGIFLTVDEADHWIERSTHFITAIQTGRFADTAITGHPGVTTMWLGGLGWILHERAVAWAFIPAEDFAVKLAFMQLPVALINAGAIVLGYYLLRRLLPESVAFCAALFWAADPFIIGYSRVLHVDALTGTWATIGILAACVYWYHTPRRWLLVLSGCSAALAMLSKSPGAVVVPIVGLIALSAQPWKSALRSLTLWSLCGVVTVVLLWPAIWTAPLQVFALLLNGVEENGAVPHSNGNFFLGQADPAPGPLFYPAALVLRTTPWTLLGLLLVPLALRRATAARRRDLAAIALLVIILVGGLSLFPKKHNRYIEPAFPAVDILAAAGLLSVLNAHHKRRVASTCAILGVAASINAAFWHPYGITAFNQMLGGAPAGAHDFLIGWGEGMEQVADWLKKQPDLGQVWIASTLKEPLDTYLPPGTRVMTPRLDIPERIGYIVVYVRSVQDASSLDYPFNQFYGREEPVHTVTIHGVPYAWIYQVPRPVAHQLSANFSSALRLRGYTIEQSQADAGLYTLHLAWETLRNNNKDYAVFAHVIGPDGQRYAQLDPQLPSSQVGAHRLLRTDFELRLPNDAPAGDYQVLLGVYDPENGQRLEISGATTADPSIDGSGALRLERLWKP